MGLWFLINPIFSIGLLGELDLVDEALDIAICSEEFAVFLI